MNVSVNTVLVAFELSLSAFSQHTLSHLIRKSGTDIFVGNGAVVSDIQNNETASSGIRIDLEKLAGIDGNDGALWNVELKRSRSLEPIFCTFRLPPLILGGKFLFSNVVASIRPSGVVHVLGSGSVEGILGISMKIQELLSTLLRRDAINEALVLRPVTATESSEKCGKKRERAKVEEEECLWQVATEFCRKLEDPDAVLPAKEKKKIHNERHTGGQDVGRTPPPLFTLPSVLFARAAIYPSRRELRRLRLVALQERTEHTLLENSNEETANLTALHEKCSSEPGGTDEFKHFSSTPEEIVAEDQKHSIHPSLKVNRRIISPLPYRECRTSFVRRKGKPYGLFFFNATGEEAVRWISCFLGEGKDGRSIQEEEAFLLSTCPPNRVHRSVIRRKLRFVRHHILHGNVKRLSKRKGIQIQVLCRNTFGASKGVLPAVREDLCSTSLAFDNTTMESDGSSLCTTSQGVHSPSNFMLDSVAVDYSSVSYDDRDARPKYLQMNEEDNGEKEACIKVDCTLFSSGMGSVVSKSLEAIHFFVREIVIFLLLVHADF